MPTQTIYQADAFTAELFGGNPAAVCLLDEWLPDALMQNIALENNLAETAFVVRNGDRYEIRWFTPTVEINLCGHATLAAAHVLFTQAGFGGEEIAFHSHRSGPLPVRREGNGYSLNFPANPSTLLEVIPEGVTEAMGEAAVQAFRSPTDLLLLYSSEQAVRALTPDFNALGRLPFRGVIATAAGQDVDFVSRFFGPAVGVNEDPVTGSAHTVLVPYWASVLGKNELKARQVSARGGYLRCTLAGDRVHLWGRAVLYLKGEIYW